MSLQLGGTILLTGSNRGIGLELVRQLCACTQADTHIYACCREPYGPRAQALRELASVYPGKISITKLDVSDEDSISSVVQTLTEQLQHTGLNLLINNAAILVPDMPGPMSETTKKDMMDCYNTNVAGPFLLSKMLLPLLTRAAETHPQTDQGSMSCRRSAIINMSTLAGSIEKCPENFHMAQVYPYRTSKAALNMLTCCQALDFKPSNILVTAIHPGWVRTEMGGAQAPLDVQESAQGVLTVMSSLSDKDSGTLVSWEGEQIPW